MEALPEYTTWGFGAVVVLYLIVRIITGKMVVWSPAQTDEEARSFRVAIFSYKPVWFGYIAWFGLAIASFVMAINDQMLSRFPVFFVIAMQLWCLHTPRIYRGVSSRVLTATLPFTLAFFCFFYPKDSPEIFFTMLAWIATSMLMQVFTLKAISLQDFSNRIERFEVFNERNVFGQPGRGLMNSGLDEGKVKVGLMGEQKTADVLNKVAQEIPGLYVFHSLRWLSDSTYDVDHALYYKGSIVFIDSKFWGAGTHEIDAHSFIYKNGNVRDIQIHLPVVLEQYEELLSSKNIAVPNSDVWVVVHAEKDEAVVIGTSGSNHEAQLLAGYDLEAHVHRWVKLLEDKNFVASSDVHALAALQDNLK